MAEMELEREIYNNLALSIVRQAIDDWQKLCKMSEEEQVKEQSRYNFDEIERFFKNDCCGYLGDVDISAERIYRVLAMERNRANRSKSKAVV